MHVVADDEAAQLLENQNQPERQQHLLQMVAAVQAADQRPFENESEAAASTIPSGIASHRLPVSDDSVNAR